MESTEQQAILTIALLAAFADNQKTDSERAEIRRVISALGTELNLAAQMQDVLLGRATIESAVAAISAPQARQLAYELAVGVCDADGLRNEDETRFLAALGSRLGLNAPQMAQPAALADALATLPLDDSSATAESASDDLDKMILNYSVLNGALELLPQSLASMAIIPLQMKMVYRIGKRHGYELDRGHVKDLLAAVGVGLTGQYLEEVGRKLIGGLFGKVVGGMVGALARNATGMAFSFATTYALGQVARRYYAGGRTMNAETLKANFTELLGEARALQARYLPQIQQRAGTLDVQRIVQLVRAQ